MSYSFDIFLQNPLYTVTYLLLLCSIASIWFKDKNRAWLWFLLLAVLFGYISTTINLIGLLFVITAGSCFYLGKSRNKCLAVAAKIIALILSAGFLLHMLPGFKSFQVANKFPITSDAIPYSLWLSFDKPLIGIFIFAFYLTPIHRLEDIKQMIRTMWPIALVTIAFMMVVALFSGFTRFEPKINSFFIVWGLANLFFAAVAEEALFRGFILRGIQKTRLGAPVALIVSAALFGAAHFIFPVGISLVILAFIAGLFYGWVYLKTKRIESSILLHFVVNVIQYIFFVYPALAHH